MGAKDDLTFLETKESTKSLAKLHYEYYKQMKELCEDEETAKEFTVALISGLGGK